MVFYSIDVTFTVTFTCYLTTHFIKVMLRIIASYIHMLDMLFCIDLETVASGRFPQEKSTDLLMPVDVRILR